MNANRTPFRALLTCALAPLLAACSGCASAPSAPLRVAICPWPGYEFVYLAQERGFFEAEGIEVQLVELESPGDLRAAFENKSVDAIGASLAELLVCREQGSRSPQAFLIVDWSNGADVLLADSTIRSLAGLRGQRIAIEPGSVDVIAIWAALGSAGLTLADVELAPMPQNEKLAAFGKDGIRAVQCFPPASTALAARPGVHPLFDSSRTPGLIADAIVADSASLANDTRRWRAFVRAVCRAQDWAREHTDEANALMAAREGLTPAEFATALAGVHVVRREEQEDALASEGPTTRALATTQEALLSTGTMTRRISPASLVTLRAIAVGDGR